MELKRHIQFYSIPAELEPVMIEVKEPYWYLFHSKKIIYTGERSIILTTGYYTGTGANSKRVDVTDFITQACVRSGYRFSAYNDAPKGGVKGQKVKIWF